VTVGRALGYRIEYWGAPLGMEAQGFLESLVMASRGDSGLTDRSKALLERVQKDVLVQTFVTPTCPHCPRAVRLGHQAAIERPGRVRSVCVEATQNPDLSRRFGVSAVPQQVLDGDLATATRGAQPEGRTMRQVAVAGAGGEAAVQALEESLRAASATAFADRPDHPIEATDENFEALLARYPLVVVDFWAEWCGPCRMVAPVVAELAKEMAGRVAFAKLDTEASQETSARFAVHSIPSLIVFRDGQEVDRIVGARPKPALKAEIERHLAG